MYQSIGFSEEIYLYVTLKEDLKLKGKFKIIIVRTNHMANLVLV